MYVHATKCTRICTTLRHSTRGCVLRTNHNERPKIILGPTPPTPTASRFRLGPGGWWSPAQSLSFFPLSILLGEVGYFKRTPTERPRGRGPRCCPVSSNAGPTGRVANSTGVIVRLSVSRHRVHSSSRMGLLGEPAATLASEPPNGGNLDVLARTATRFFYGNVFLRVNLDADRLPYLVTRERQVPPGGIDENVAVSRLVRVFFIKKLKG